MVKENLWIYLNKMGFIDCTEHKITPDETWNLTAYDVKYNLGSIANSLQKYLKPGKFIQIFVSQNASVKGLEKITMRLRQERLNIGENNEQFGDDIWPQCKDTKKDRRLSVYRRRK